jgi:hemoglobin/transferrin/lactoferrin receptor protein
MVLARPRRFPPLFLVLVALLFTPFLAARGQTPPEPPNQKAPPAAVEKTGAQGAPAAVPSVADTITVTATRTPTRILDTAGNVSVLHADEIEKRMATDPADLVRYEPGVYVNSDPTRLGLNGFNIRGIGGNRVLTQIDGIRTAEQFDFGPLSIYQVGLDVDALESMEIVRSAGSSLYGSDALGGVVSLLTRNPADYLRLGGDGRFFADLRQSYDGRRQESGTTAAVAWGSDRWQASLFGGRRQGGETDNMGRLTTHDATRTAPNPIDRRADDFLGKVVFNASAQNAFKVSGEWFDARAAPDVFSAQGIQDLGGQFGPGVTYLIDTHDSTAVDRQRRARLSLEQNLVRDGKGLFDTLQWRLYGEKSPSRQETLESRTTTMGGGPLGPLTSSEAVRNGLFSFDQRRDGGEVQFNKGLRTQKVEQLWTWGASLARNEFSMLRDRADRRGNGAVIPSSTPYPTKYFPDSRLQEGGVYVQDEILIGNLRVVPGLRYDRFSLNPDEDDAVFLSGNPGTPVPEGMHVGAWSPKLAVVQRLGEVSAFVQYARGFRAPAYSDVNNGFTNVAFGYTTLPNPELKPETSNNLEAGLRAATTRFGGGLVVFDNHFRDFIETVTVGVDPRGFVLFQPRNVSQARIRGVELYGEARIGRNWQLRGSAAAQRGDNETADVPLNSIPPAQASLGLLYSAKVWGGELATTVAASKSGSRIDRSTVNQFATPAYQLVDLTAYRDLGAHLRLQVGLFNLLDQKYWLWPNVLGQVAGAPILDRYTAPGRSVSLSMMVRR